SNHIVGQSLNVLQHHDSSELRRQIHHRIPQYLPAFAFKVFRIGQLGGIEFLVAAQYRVERNVLRAAPLELVLTFIYCDSVDPRRKRSLITKGGQSPIDLQEYN